MTKHNLNIQAYSTNRITIDHVPYTIESQDAYSLLAKDSQGNELVIDKQTHKAFFV